MANNGSQAYVGVSLNGVTPIPGWFIMDPQFIMNNQQYKLKLIIDIANYLRMEVFTKDCLDVTNWDICRFALVELIQLSNLRSSCGEELGDLKICWSILASSKLTVRPWQIGVDSYEFPLNDWVIFRLELLICQRLKLTTKPSIGHNFLGFWQWRTYLWADEQMSTATEWVAPLHRDLDSTPIAKSRPLNSSNNSGDPTA